MITHPIEPVYNESSRILILGSFPSVASREQNFFYGHPQNRFWKVLSEVFERPIPETVEEKRAFLLNTKVAVWDVIASCEITGSADSSIKNVVPNDLSILLEKAPIRRIFVNGKTAERFYNQYVRNVIHREAICLPSTSPANAAWSKERLLSEWKVIREFSE